MSRLSKRSAAAFVGLVTAIALALPVMASADTIVGGTFTLGGNDPSAVTTIASSTLYRDYARGVAAQFSAVCDGSVTVDGYPSLSHGPRLLLPLPWLRPFNVTTDWDSQTVHYTAYLFRWSGSAWTYDGVAGSATYWVAEWSPESGFASQTQASELPAGRGYYAVAVSYRWVSNQTGALVNSLYYWAPITEANGASASYCTFA